jgi:pyruvate formate lyase activating enzyme
MLKICNVDLKCFTEKGYRELGGKLKGVLETIETLKEMGVWVEVVTLVVLEFNTEPGGLEGIAKFIAGVSPDIPWHVTAFRPAYRSNQAASTPAEALKRAYDVGHEAGLKFVYTGNLRGAHDSGEDTLCPGCRSVLVKRRGFSLMENRIRNGKCPDCREDIPGVWEVPRQ